MKRSILNNWNLMRFIRLGLGISILIQSITQKDWTIGILGILFISMPIFNIGCCGGACSIPPLKKEESTKQIVYEEVK